MRSTPSPWWRARGPWFARLTPPQSAGWLDWRALLAGGEATMPLPGADGRPTPGAGRGANATIANETIAIARRRRSGPLPSAEAALAWARDALAGAPPGHRVTLRAGRERRARFAATTIAEIRAAARAVAGWWPGEGDAGAPASTPMQRATGALTHGSLPSPAPAAAPADGSPPGPTTAPPGGATDTLTPAQRAVVEHGGAPAVVIAVAGAGKTTTMVARVAERVRRGLTDPAHLLLISFSRAAVAAIGAKLRQVPALAAVDVRTFHALAHRILQRYAALGGPPLVRGPGPGEVVGQVIERARARARAHDPDLADAWRDVDVAAFTAYRGRCLARLALPPDLHLPPSARALVRDLPDDPDHPAHAALLADFEAVRRPLGWLDHDQVLIAAFAALHASAPLRSALRERYRAVIVDEAQDVNAAQLALLEPLTEGRDDVMLIGDDDQSIYGFRGAEPGSLRGFAERRRARVLVLPDAFRSRAEPLAAATALMSHGVGRWPVRPRAARGPGGALTLDLADDGAAEAAALLARAHAAHASGVAWGEQVVLLRRFAQATALEEAAARARIPVRVEGAAALARQGVVIAAWAGVALALAPPPTPAARERTWRRWLSGPGGFTRAEAWVAARRVAAFALPGAEAWRAAGVVAPPGVSDPAARLAALTASSGAPDGAGADAPGGAGAGEAAGFGGAERAAAARAHAAAALVAIGSDPRRWPAAPPAALAATARLIADGVAYLSGDDAVTPTDAARALAAAYAGWRDTLARHASTDALTLTSVHRAKGLEWRVVHVPGMNAGSFPLGPDAEERRLAYVAWTRARDALHLYRDRTAPPSPFLREGEVAEIEALTHDLATLAARPSDAATLAGAWALREARSRFGGEGEGYDALGPASIGARRSPLEASVGTHRSPVGAGRTRSAP